MIYVVFIIFGFLLLIGIGVFLACCGTAVKKVTPFLYYSMKKDPSGAWAALGALVFFIFVIWILT